MLKAENLTSSGLRPVDSPVPSGSAVPAFASGELLSRAPSPLKSPQSGEGPAEGVAPERGGEGRGSGSRLPLERVMRIHHLLQNKQFPNCPSLAREFEVVPRTIKRDIEFMKVRMRLPIGYDSKRYGYFYTEPVEHFPHFDVTEGELFSLVVAYKAVALFQRTPFKAPLETAFQKLAGQRHDHQFSLGSVDRMVSFRPFAPEESNGEALDLLTRAVQSGTAVEFIYRKLGGAAAARRQVHPYHLACIDSQWYLLAFDTARKAIRSFVLARLREAKLLDETFQVPKHFNPAEYLRGSFSAFKGKEDYEVVIDFDAWSADLIRERKWHVTQKVTEGADGGIRLQMRLNSIEEAERWVLSWGTHATVIGPAALCNRVHEVCAELSARYLRQLKEEAKRPV
jgi:predicted DNA-binding transcriptional regulator YafY